MFPHFAVKSRTAQQAKMKWVVNIVFYILQVGEYCIEKHKLILVKYSDITTVCDPHFFSSCMKHLLWTLHLMLFMHLILAVLEIECKCWYGCHNDKLRKYLNTYYIPTYFFCLSGSSDDLLDMEVLLWSGYSGPQ